MMTNHGSKLFIYFSLVFFASLANAEAHGSDNQQWASITAMGPVSAQSSYGFYLEYQSRHSEAQERVYQTFIRPAFYRKLNDHESVWIGFLSLRKYDFSETEERLWQQYSYTDQWSNLKYGVRLRQEQRFYKETQDDKAVQHKTRLQVRASGAGEWKIKPLLWDELHWNWNTSPGRSASGYDQNRLFVGLTTEVAPSTFLDLGYLNQNVNRISGETLVAHCVSATLQLKW